MDVRSAELTKYAANCMLATKISFMNEMANLAERLGADIEAVRQGIGSDQRIGYHFIYPGAGYGGSCFPKDVKALIHTARAVGFEPKVLAAVEDRNDAQKTVLFDKIARTSAATSRAGPSRSGASPSSPTPTTCARRPPACVMEALWDAGARVQAYDPEAMEEAQRLYGDRDDLALCGTKEAALQGADALVVAHRVAGVPGAGLRPDRRAAAQGAGDLRRPQPLRPGAHGARGFAYYAIGRGLPGRGRRPRRAEAAA